jgi:hypothetical protein
VKSSKRNDASRGITTFRQRPFEAKSARRRRRAGNATGGGTSWQAGSATSHLVARHAAEREVAVDAAEREVAVDAAEREVAVDAASQPREHVRERNDGTATELVGREVPAACGRSDALFCGAP